MTVKLIFKVNMGVMKQIKVKKSDSNWNHSSTDQYKYTLHKCILQRQYFRCGNEIHVMYLDNNVLLLHISYNYKYSFVTKIWPFKNMSLTTIFSYSTYVYLQYKSAVNVSIVVVRFPTRSHLKPCYNDFFF